MSAQTALRSIPNEQEPGHTQPRVTAPRTIVDAPCVLIRPDRAFPSKQGHHVLEGICAESAGSTALSLHVISIPPGGRALSHLHRNHESAIYMLEGEAICWYGEGLRHSFRISPGEMAYIPAGVPHLPMNASQDKPVSCVIARTDANEQESVHLLPELDDLPHLHS
ncbi:MAG: hypothetical protein QOJ63_432 [Solirubrobacteraceae bacterium]|jgi:uncharacterized RmlC-like cupin family protein|nr:hypothetical protein [Solirubrobacteraceae bacterium]